MNHRRYIVTLKHDYGTVRLSIMAGDRTAAITGVCIAEGAPRSAVLRARLASNR